MSVLSLSFLLIFLIRVFKVFGLWVLDFLGATKLLLEGGGA